MTTLQEPCRWPGTVLAAWYRRMYERIAVALDGSDLAERVLPYVESLAIRFGSTIVLLRVVGPPGAILAGSGVGAEPVAGPIVDATPIVEAERQEATSYLRSVAQHLRDAGIGTELDVPEGRPAPTIVERATELSIDLVAMTTHGRSGLRRLVLGSVADEVIRHASCPILLIRASAADSPRNSRTGDD